jgi:2,3-bisphosphoglycerate-independent phosphoglycerate mutase
MKNPQALIILDGFGYRKETAHNAIAQAHMPHFRSWLQQYPHTLLEASGAYVGLPPHVPGNSLVGHTTIGAGRIVLQPTTILLHEIQTGSFFRKQEILEKFHALKKSGGTLHLMGLLSDSGNHSHEDVAYALIRMAHTCGLPTIVHAFLDGRDVPSRSAHHYLSHLDAVMRQAGTTKLGTLMGRSFPMDRTHNTGTVTKAFSLLTSPHQPEFNSWQSALDSYYARNITDEFIPPTNLAHNAHIKDGDGLIFWNTRADRALLLSELFIDAQHPNLMWFITGTRYAEHPTTALVQQSPIPETLLDIFRTHKIRVGSFCESEKFAHVTYFFNGGHEVTNPHDLYVVVPSPDPTTFEQHPEMAARDITDMIQCSLQSDPRDFYLVNYANADMIGHTGNIDATIKAVEILDEELGKLFELFVQKRNGRLYITADHGNAELIGYINGELKKGHTCNQVPFLIIDTALHNKSWQLPLHELADIAPFILQQEGLPIPTAMKK